MIGKSLDCPCATTPTANTPRYPAAPFLRAAGMALLLVFSLGCAGIGPRILPDPGVEPLTPDDPSYEETIQVQYLGTGGNLLWRGRHGLLTAPLYSNPGLLRVGLWHIYPDTALINRLHPRFPEVKVEAILVGHAHYDHLLDVPYIARRHETAATIYGNVSMQRIVAVADPSLLDRVKVLDEELARGGRPGTWVYLADSTIRFMAIESDHGPHLFGIHAMKGEVREGLKAMPRSAWDWREGKTFAYLIDFLGPGGGVDFRIHFQDASSHYPLGAPPDFAPPDSHRLDLAITCVDTWFQVPDYPEAPIRNHRPRHVILGHWENFFRSPLKPPWTRFSSLRLRRSIPSVLDAFAVDADWIVPLPGRVYRYRPVRPIKK